MIKVFFLLLWISLLLMLTTTAEDLENVNTDKYIKKLLLNYNRHSNLKDKGSLRKGSHRNWYYSSAFCPLTGLGKLFNNDKMMIHQFIPIYCENLFPLRKSTKKLRMLEIGFGCAQYGNGGLGRGSSAKMWKSFFHMNHGCGVDLWEIDWPNPERPIGTHYECVNNFYKEWPKGTVVNEIFLGDQSNVTFLGDVVSSTGGDFDIIIDDGGHRYDLIKISFEYLWKHVAPGGYYFIEDMAVFAGERGKSSIPQYLMGFVDQLALGNAKDSDPKQSNSDFLWHAKRPRDLLSIHCEDEICVLRKKFPSSQYAADGFENLVYRDKP